MDTQLIACKLIDVPEGRRRLRTSPRSSPSSLADSHQGRGEYNPIVVRPDPAPPGRYIGVQGRHRLYAMKKVLKEQFIRATVIEDMDDTDADMAPIAENLWRNPLTKAQHARALKRW